MTYLFRPMTRMGTKAVYIFGVPIKWMGWYAQSWDSEQPGSTFPLDGT